MLVLTAESTATTFVNLATKERSAHLSPFSKTTTCSPHGPGAIHAGHVVRSALGDTAGDFELNVMRVPFSRSLCHRVARVETSTAEDWRSRALTLFLSLA
jgi:hypothetical protein